MLRKGATVVFAEVHEPDVWAGLLWIVVLLGVSWALFGIGLMFYEWAREQPLRLIDKLIDRSERSREQTGRPGPIMHGIETVTPHVQRWAETSPTVRNIRTRAEAWGQRVSTGDRPSSSPSAASDRRGPPRLDVPAEYGPRAGTRSTGAQPTRAEGDPGHLWRATGALAGGLSALAIAPPLGLVVYVGCFIRARLTWWWFPAILVPGLNLWHMARIAWRCTARDEHF